MRLITPDDVFITCSYPNVRINEDAGAKQILFEFIQSEWSDGAYTEYVESILSLFESVDGTYGLTEFVTFVISPQYRDSFVSVHSVSQDQLTEFVGFEDKNGVYEFGALTENMRSDVQVR